MEETSAEPRTIPEGAQYNGLDAKLRTTKPSAKFLKAQSSRRDRLQQFLAEVAEQMMQLMDQAQKEEVALTMVTDLRVDVRYDSSIRSALVVPAADAQHPPTITNAVQHISDNKVTKPKQECKQVKEMNTSRRAPFRRDRDGNRFPSVRGAAAKVISKFLGAQSPGQLKVFMKDAGIQATLLQYNTVLRFRDTKGNVHFDGGRWNDESFERVQLHFFLGRALLEVYDTLAKTPNHIRRYGVGMYQWLMEKKDVNSLSRLAIAMMGSAACSLPNDERTFVPYNTNTIRALLREVRDFERKETSDKGFWDKSDLGRVIPLDKIPLDTTPPNTQLLMPVSATGYDFNDTN